MRCNKEQAADKDIPLKNTSGISRMRRRVVLIGCAACLLGAWLSSIAPDHTHLPEQIRPHRPLWLVGANAGAGLALSALSLIGFYPKLGAGDLISASEWMTGLNDWQDDSQGSFREGLERLAKGLEDEAELTNLGRIVTWVQTTTILMNRLRIIEYGKQNPHVKAEKIEAPVFIIGMPRSGTTFLHNLLQMDPQFRAPRLWEIQDPVPPTDPNLEDSHGSKSWRILNMNVQLSIFQLLAPQLAVVHSVDALNAEECMPILGLDARSLLFNVLYKVHDYMEWLLEEPSDSPMRFHKKYLQTLQSGADKSKPSKVWLLKTPWHMQTFDALWSVYPDARIIMPHRDPAGMIASLSSLHARFNGICSDNINLEEIGKFQVFQWDKVIPHFIRQRELQPEKSSKQIIDVQFNELAKDPLATVQQIYDKFDLTLTDASRHAMQAYLNGTAGDGTGKRGNHGMHQYALEWFGLSEAELMSKQSFTKYCETFDVPRKFLHSSKYGE